MSDLYNPASARYQELAERARKREEELDQRIAPILAARKERADYYQALRDQYSDQGFPSLRDSDYSFLNEANSIINNPAFGGDAELERDRLYAAAVYANNLQKPIGMVYRNLDIFHEQWTGRKFVKKTGLQATIDSFGVSFLGEKHNALSIEYYASGQDPEVLKRLMANKQKLESLKDNVPKVWEEEYIWQGGVDDIAAIIRSLTTTVAENAVPIALSAVTGGLFGAGAGLATKLAGLPAGMAGKIVAGASMLGIAESAALHTVGTEYFDLISQGIPNDIAWTNANISGQIQGALEALSGGVAGTTTKRLLQSVAPGLIEKAAARWFIKGKMGAGAKAFLDYLREGAGEGFVEGAQQITSIAAYNMAAAQANKRRDKLLQEIYGEPIEEARKNIEKELEKYPGFDKKEFGEIWGEVREAAIGGMATALFLGIPGARIGYKNNIRAAAVLADMAQKAPSDAALIEAVEKAEAQGFNNTITEGMKTDEKAAVLSEVYKIQQERMTPEQWEAKQRAAQDAAALSEVTDYRNVEVEAVQTEAGGENGGIKTELTAPDLSDVYRENGRLEINEYTDANEDGSVSGRFVAGDPRVQDTEGSGINQYGYINYTETSDAVTIDEFKMLSGYENLRPGLFRQFAERFAGKNIQWAPRNEQNISIKDQLANANPRGPKEGLNYYEQGSRGQASAEARQIAERFRPYLKNATPLETALAVETFGAFYRRRGESLDRAMNRLLGRITNEAPEAVSAAQAEGQVVKGAIWFDRTAEGMRGIVYVNKNAADSSTVVHEISHAVAMDFTEAERGIAARALNGYKLKNGAAVSFEEGGGPWTGEQHEAFAEALENYLINGTAPNEEIRGLFERIKEFMKRVYRTMKGWTELSPEAERFYKSLLSGDLVDEAKAENGSLAHEEGPGKAREGRRGNDAAEGETAQERRYFENDELNESFKRKADELNRLSREKAQEILRREAVITDPDASPDVKAQAVMDAAGAVLMQALEKESAAEISAMKARIAEWTSRDTLNSVTGKSREEIFKEYDNTLQPIAYVPEQYLSNFSGAVSDNRVYCGQAYFLDHAVNHHPEIAIDKYGNLQEILNNPDEIIVDNRVDDRTKEKRNSLLFTKKYGTNLMAVISLKEGKDGRILLYKSLYGHKKTPYPDLPRVQGISSGGGLSPIGRTAEAIPGGNLSARDDALNIDHSVRSVNSSVETFFQTGDRDMMEEAAEFENGKDYRGYVEAFAELPREVEGFTGEQIDAWFDEFVKKAKLAVNSGEQDGGTTAGGKLTPADIDRDFNELIGEPGKLDEFVKRLADTHNENYDNWQAVDEEDAAERGRQMEYTDTLRRKLTHPTWQTAFKANGKMGDTQRKNLLTLIRKAPRDYRALYADVMERPEFAVSAEDTMAAILKYRITDSRREEVDSLSPEKLRQLAEQLDIEDFAEKVRTGKAQFNEPAERAYIKQLQGQIKEVEQALKEAEADRQEDNEYLERMAGKRFIETFNRAVEAREEIRRNSEKLDKAIAAQKRNARVFVYKAQRAAANYNSIVRNLESLAKAQKLELDVRDALENQRIHDAVQAARKELKTEAGEKIDALKDEFRKIRERERAKASLQKKFAVLTAIKELKAYHEDLKERQESQKENIRARNAVVKRIFRPINTREVNAEQGRAAAIIQRLAEPSMLEGIDRFIGGIEKPYLRTIFETWKTDEILRAGVMKDKTKATREKISRLFSKESFDHLTGEEKKYLYRVMPPKDWATALGLESIISRRNENYPAMNGEAEQQIAFKHLPPDVYYRIMDKPFSEWTLEEGEELAKIIDGLIVQGKEIRKATIDAERRRIKEYQRAVVKTIGTVAKRGLEDSPDDSPEERARKKAEREKILNKYNEAQGHRGKLKGPFLEYADMAMYRYARMLDNGDPNGKNSAMLYRRAGDAYNMKMAAIDARMERIEKVMREQNITKTELWEKAVEIDLGGDLGKTTFTAAELIGFLSATRDDYSRAAVMYGNLLSEHERGLYQYDGITMAELVPLYDLAEGRFDQVKKAAEKLAADAPKYRQLMDAIDADFTEGGKRLSEALVRFNNTFMPIVDKYFPIHREAPVNVHSADADLARDLMGASSGAFNLFVEKGFTNERQAIPPQYQTKISLDILGVWTEAVSREEHFMAYGQLVKDLNAIYKGNRQVKDAIQRRYGQGAVDYINKYINELANPAPEMARSGLDKAIKAMRGNTASAYLGWKVSTIVKQFITSPAPFFGYMNPLEYWGAFVKYITSQGESWKEITELSEHMKHRSANLLIDLVKEQAKQRHETKVGAAISSINERGIKGLEWIDRMCVAPGWMVLYRKELGRLTGGDAGVTMTERDAKIKAAQYADDITRATQPSPRPEDIAPLFKGNNELGKAYLQFTQSLNIVWQNIRYDVPQMIRDRRYSNAAGIIMGTTIAGIMLGAITEWFEDDDDETERAARIAKWAALQFTDTFPIIGSEATHLAEVLITGKARHQSGLNLIPAVQKMRYAAESGIRGGREEDFNKLLKAAATAAEGAAIFTGLPASGIKEAGLILGIGGDGEPGIHPEAILGRR